MSVSNLFHSFFYTEKKKGKCPGNFMSVHFSTEVSVNRYRNFKTIHCIFFNGSFINFFYSVPFMISYVSAAFSFQ